MLNLSGANTVLLVLVLSKTQAYRWIEPLLFNVVWFAHTEYPAFIPPCIYHQHARILLLCGGT